MQYNNLPVFNIVLDSEEDGLQLVSLVDYPAVCESFLKFKEEHKTLTFTTDNEQHIISGVSLLADTPIYRNDGGEGYYVVFTKETIKELVEKYNKENKTNLTSLQHNGQIISDCIMVESYFIDKERGICPKEFEHCPDGSWITSYKVTSDELWDEIKNSGELNGFSVEINCQLEPAQEGQKIYDEPVDEFVNEENDFWSELLSWLQDEDFEKKKFSVSKGDIVRAIENKNPVFIDEGKSKIATEYWVYQLGRKDGEDVAVLYNPLDNKWSTKKLSDIKNMVTGTGTTGIYDFTDPSYKKIVDDPDIVVTKTVHTTSFNDLIHNRVMTMLTYNDEKDKPALGFRQCAVIAHGYTTAGNECIRVMEVFGDSRSAKDGTGKIPDYRLLLTRRIMDLKPMTNTAPWDYSVLDSRVNLTGDKSMSPCIDHITRIDLGI